MDRLHPGNSRLRAAVLLSGNGSNMQAIVDYVRGNDVPCDVRLVVSNTPSARGLARARQAGIETRVVDHRAHATRDAFDRALERTLNECRAELIVLAGFMRILSEWFVERHAARMINVHPSLLPRHKGLDTHRRVIEAGEARHGATVHFVTAELDGGPSIVRGLLRVRRDDTPESLQRRVRAIEHRIYPLAVEWFANRRLSTDCSSVWLDDRRLPETGVETVHDDV